MESLMQPHIRLLLWTAIAFCIATFVGTTTAKVIGEDRPVKRPVLTVGITAMVMMIYGVLAIPGLLEA